MATYPQKNKRAKTGSNLRGKPLQAHHLKTVAEQGLIYQRNSRDYRREAKKLFSYAELRTAARIAGEAHTEWCESNLRANGDAEKWVARKRAARRKLDRLLTKALPNFRNWMALKREHLHQHQKLAKLNFNQVTALQLPVGWGVVSADPPPTDLRNYGPPFRLFDVTQADDSGMIKSDESSVDIAVGDLFNDLEFELDEDTAIILGVFGLLGRARASGIASCGVPFTLPRAGRLYIAPELENTYSQVTLSLQDRFGFSAGKIEVTINLVITVVGSGLNGVVVTIPKILFTTQLLSDGDNTSSVMPELDGTYSWNRTTNETFAQNESVSILAGAEVHVYTELDDMRSRVSAILGWKLKRLRVGVVDPA